MKSTIEPQTKASLNGVSDFLIRLEDVLSNSKPPIKEWLFTQIEAILSELPFKEASLKSPLAPVRDTTPNRLLNPQEASILLNVPVRWIYRHSKKLPHRKFGRYMRFPQNQLLRWANEQRDNRP